MPFVKINIYDFFFNSLKQGTYLLGRFYKLLGTLKGKLQFVNPDVVVANGSGVN